MADKVNGWTVETLRIYLEALIRENEKASIAWQEQAIRSVSKSEESISHRLSSMNEFRGQLNDVLRQMLPRSEFDSQHANLERRLTENAKRTEDLSGRVDTLTGKSGGLAQGWTYLMAILTVGIAIYALLKP